MRETKIIAAWDKMNPDNSTKEKMLRKIMDMDTMETNRQNSYRIKYHRYAVGFAAAILLLLGSFGTAYAASPAFREYVNSLLFPLYSSDEMISIDNGHMTGSFDKVDVLLSFLDKLNKGEFGNSISAAKENGYRYDLFAQNENQLLAFVDSSANDYCVVVYMEQLEQENTAGIWQVTGYQILEKTAAENMKNELEPYSEKPTDEITSVPREDTTIKGTVASVILYNVNDKKHIVSVKEDDGRRISDILNACDRSEDITGGLFQYVIKINDTSYMFDSDGNGMVNTAGNRWGIVINENELNELKALFEQYHVSLEEIAER